MGSAVNAVSDVERAKLEIKNIESQLSAAKRSRDDAKKNGSYKRSAKNYSHNGKMGTVYDNNVWTYEDALKRAKQRLADAKKRK